MESGAEEVRWELLASCPSLLRVEDAAEGVVDVWRGVVGRVYAYYRMAAASYLTYLKLNGQVGVLFVVVTIFPFNKEMKCSQEKPVFL